MNQIDLIVHAGTQLALWQWLQARGLGTVTQDTDPTSPTFGEWGYEHTDPNSEYLWWRHPQGRMEATRTVDDTDPENPIVSVTYFSGWYATLRFRTAQAMEDTIGDWMQNNTAISVLESFTGVGGEGITVVKPEDVNAHLDGIGMPRHAWLGTGLWSDPTLWYLSPVMTGDQREFDGVVYESLIDFNVWTQQTAPQLWQEVEP